LGRLIKCTVLIGKNFGETVALAAAKKVTDILVLLDYRSKPFFKSHLLVIGNFLKLIKYHHELAFFLKTAKQPQNIAQHRFMVAGIK
jgi:hypothetical protein